MQDNVTQAEVIVARHIDAWGWGPLDQIEGLAEHKLAVDACAAGLASTAQPEVKALVEALEAIKAQTSAEDDAGENYRWDDREGALDFAYATAAQALTAYHEAQP